MQTKPIFMESWWLDAVCAGKHWEEILPNMPCLINKRWWMRYVVMPQMTQIGGMWGMENGEWRMKNGECMVREIDAKLRGMKLAYYYQQYPVGSPLPQLFKPLGYKVKERVTYRIDDLSDLDAVMHRFSKNKKRQLQKALTLNVERGMSAEAFYRFHTGCMTARNRQPSYSREFLLVLERKARRLGCCETLRITNMDGDTCAAAFVVWDSEYLYYLIPCYSPMHKDTGAGARLVFEAIKLAKEKGLKFDFEGSMKRGIANHYKQFGSTPATYYSVSKVYKWYFYIALLINRLRIAKFGI
ncbi:MAG: GNAT family N-acetyltransferase [Paludibacteraceae bacterium]|nr:GNAT family N-acetyltransferase [Paludibacteraceae bacterium]